MIGFLNVYKPSGMTSSRVVAALKKRYHLDKVGHMGTLDPMACGVLPIAIGKATRMFDYFLDKYKIYKATFTFGYQTDTLDSDGVIILQSDNIPSMVKVKEIAATMVGQISQVPPQFSAKLVNGVRAYKLARAGENVELSPKVIEIKRCDVIKQIDNSSFEIEIECSSGTYIRSIARDMATALGTYATMTSLERVQSGVFDINKAVKLEDLLADNTRIDDYLYNILDVFPLIPRVELTSEQYNKLKSGISISAIKYDTAFVTYNGTLLGVAANKDNVCKIKTYLME